MPSALELLDEYALIAVIDTPELDAMRDCALALAKGGIRLVAIPVGRPDALQVVADLTDEADLVVGFSGVVSAGHISSAVAAEAHFVLSPTHDPQLTRTALDHGLLVISGAMTPTEITAARRDGATRIAIHPAGALGPAYLRALTRTFPSERFVATGGIDVDSAPNYLEAGAAAVVVDTGLLPAQYDASTLGVLRARALALTEVCTEVLGQPKRISLTDLLEDA